MLSRRLVIVLLISSHGLTPAANTIDLNRLNQGPIEMPLDKCLCLVGLARFRGVNQAKRKAYLFETLTW